MNNNELVVEQLNGLLADTTVLYQKLRHYHWNVRGEHFFTLHIKFEELYTTWATTIDAIAERILTVGGVPLHTLTSLVHVSEIAEDETLPEAGIMVENITTDYQLVLARAARVIEAAEAVADRGTANLMDALVDVVEKNIWMLQTWQKEAAWA